MPWLGKMNVAVGRRAQLVKRSDGVGRKKSVTMQKLLIGDGYKHMMRK